MVIFVKFISIGISVKSDIQAIFFNDNSAITTNYRCNIYLEFNSLTSNLNFVLKLRI